jgi:Family of unknown function (DUF6192)
MQKRTFRQAVQHLQELDVGEGASAFDMGDTVLEQAPMGRDGAHNGSAEVIARLAAGSGVSHSVLEERRQVSAVVPPTARAAGVAWSVYREIVNHGQGTPAERKALIEMVATKPAETPSGRWTVDAVGRHRGMAGMPRKADVEANIEALASDPAAAAAAIAQLAEAAPEAMRQAYAEKPAVREAVIEQQIKEHNNADARREAKDADSPVVRKLDQLGALLDLVKALDKFSDAVDKYMPALGDLPPADATDLLAGSNWAISSAYARAQERMASIQTFLDVGKTPLDTFLGSVLKGGDK